VHPINRTIRDQVSIGRKASGFRGESDGTPVAMGRKDRGHGTDRHRATVASPQLAPFTALRKSRGRSIRISC
jgi:hypothetical protein